MIFKKCRKILFYALLIGTWSIFVVQSQQLSLGTSFNLVEPMSFSKAVTDDNSLPTEDSSSFDFVDQKLNKQFEAIVTRLHNSLMKGINWSFYLPLGEIFQYDSMDYFLWHTRSEYTWYTPLDIYCHIYRIPVYRSVSSTEHSLESDLGVSENNVYIDNDYLYGNFPDDGSNGYDWYHPRIFNFAKYVKQNLVGTRTENRCVEFSKLIMKTQEIPFAYSDDDSRFVDLSSIDGHEFGDSYYDNYYFPYSGEIHDWGGADVGLRFGDLYSDYVTLGTKSAFNCTLDRVWSKSVKYYVSRKTLLIIDSTWKKRELLNLPCLDVSKLFQLGSIGYDHKAKKYWYTVTFNQALLKGAIGAYYDEGIANLLAEDFSSDKKIINLSDYTYWNDQNRGLAQYETGGTHSWVNPALVNFEDQKNYPSLIDHLYKFLDRCVENRTLTYDNYLNVKQKINTYVLANHCFPTNDFIGDKLTSDPEWRDNGWAADAHEYDLDSDAVRVLAFALPEMRFSQFSMFDTTGTGNANWSNLDQDWNIGTVYHDQICTSSFDDMLKGRNRILLDPSRLAADAPVNIMFNVGVVASAQTSDHFDYQDNYTLVNDPISMLTYKSCNEENAQSISAITDGNIQIKRDSFIEQKPGRSIVDFGYYQIKRDGEKIIPTNRLKTSGVIFRKDLMKQFPSEVWANAKKQNHDDVIKAIKSLFQDADGAPALPFCRADLWTNTLVDYNIPAEKLQVQTDDEEGTITFNLIDSLESVEISGLKQKSVPVGPAPTPSPSPDPSPDPSSSPGDETRAKSVNESGSHGVSLIIAISLLMTGCVATMLWVWLATAKSKKDNKKIQMYHCRNYPEYYPRNFNQRRSQPRRCLPPHRNQFSRNPRNRWTNFDQRKSNW